MINSSCLKKDFTAIEQLSSGVWRLKFSARPEMVPMLNEDGEPTGEMTEGDWVIYTTQLVTGPELTPDMVRKVRIAEVTQYDKSAEVNDFIFAGKHMWFDKNTRTVLVHSMNVEKAAGKETTDLYDNDNERHVIAIDTALDIFAQIELYAKSCYKKTAEHKAQLSALDDIDELLAYDIKVGYPERLSWPA